MILCSHVFCDIHYFDTLFLHVQIFNEPISIFLQEFDFELNLSLRDSYSFSQSLFITTTTMTI